MSHNDFAIGRADFTIDFWVRFNSLSGTQFLFSFPGSGLTEAGPVLWVTSSELNYSYNNQSAVIDGTVILAVNTWYHIAVVRSGTSTRLFVNGTQDGVTYTDVIDYQVGSGAPFIGIRSDATLALNGWIDELRIRIGEAVWTSNFTPPAAPYSEVLLLHANGTDASTVFTDSSPQPKTVTAVGNAQLDTAQKKFGTASVLFDGTGDYLHSVANNVSEFSFGDGDFTVDFWVRFNSLAADVFMIDFRPTPVDSLGIWYENSSNTIRVGAEIASSAGAVTTGTWYHIAVTRSGKDKRLFINGTQAGGTYNSDVKNYQSTNGPYIGSVQGTSSFLNGWLDEIRVLKGKAAWTSNFAVPSHEYHMAAVARERLLLHGDGVDGSTTITDSSYWARNAVATGNAQIDTAQKKFGTGSILFDGVSEYVLISDPDDFDFGTGDFTIDCWFRVGTDTSDRVVWSFEDGSGNAAYLSLYLHSTSVISVYGGSSNLILGTTALSAGTWYHAALTRSGGNSLKLFLNGIQEGSTYTGTQQFSSGEHGLIVGVSGFDLSAGVFDGWVEELRVVVGTAHWTSSFLPWPSAYDTPANVLLLHANGADATRAFPDNNDIPRAHKITVNGDTRIDTAQSKFGGASLLFDGTGDSLTLDGSSDFAFGTGDFTIDMWVRLNATGQQHHLIDFRSNSDAGFLTIVVDSDNKVKYYVSSGVGAITDTTTTLTTGTWYHVALTRSGTSTKLFLNGTQEGSTYSDSNNYTLPGGPGTPRIGEQRNGGNALNGWLDEIRIKRGEAVWTSNFTPPSAAYNPSDGHLLIHGDGPNANVLMICDVGTASGKTDIIVNADAQVDTAQQKFGTASALFDGTGDYLNVA